MIPLLISYYSCYTIAMLIILMLFIHKSIHPFYEQYGIDNGQWVLK